MVFNATLNNILVISWQSVFLVHWRTPELSTVKEKKSVRNTIVLSI